MKKLLFILLIALASCEKPEPQKTFDVTYLAYSKNYPFTVQYATGEPGKSQTETVNSNTFEKTLQVTKYDYQMTLIVKCFTKYKKDSIHGTVKILNQKDELGYAYESFEGQVEVKLKTPTE